MKKIFKKAISSFLIAGFLLNAALPVNKASAMTAPWWSGSQATGTSGVAAPPSSGESSLSDNRRNQQQAGEPVSVHNGDFVYQHQDFSIPSRAISTEITRTYKSQSRYNNRFGYGWDISYNRKIISICNGDLYYLNGELNRYRFLYVDGTNYISPKGIYDTIVQNLDGTYTLTEKHGTTCEFDQNGVLTEIKDRNGNSLHFSYEAAGKLPIIGKSVFSNDPNPKVIAYDYKLVKITDTVGREITLNYNANGQLQSIVDFSGRAYTYAYDPSGNGDLLSFTTPATEGYPAGFTTTYSYTEHNLKAITDAKGETYLTNYYDENDRVYQQDSSGGTFVFSYDTANSRTTITDPKGFVTEWSYDSNGSPISKKEYTSGLRPTDPASYTTTYQYNNNLERTSITYPAGNGIKYTYDEGNPDLRSRGNLLEIRRKSDMTQPDDNLVDLVTTFTYESRFNFIKTLTDPKGNITTYYYDYEEVTLGDLNGDGITDQSNGNLVKITYPAVGAQTPETKFTYNSYGQVLTVTDPNGNVTKYEYSAATGYLTKTIQSYGSLNLTTEMTYDSVGNVASVKDPKLNTTTFEYDSHNNLTKTTSASPFNYISKYKYDANDNLIQIDRQTGDSQNPWQATYYTYDSLDRLETIKDELAHTTTFTYDANGNRNQIKDAGLNLTIYEYDERNLLWKITDALGNTTEYTYDENGNLEEIKDARGNRTTYAFDDFDRLIETTYQDGSKEEYTYDANSNLITKTDPKNQTIYYEYDTLNRLSEKGLSPQGTVPNSVVSYVYDIASRLTKVTDANDSIAYTYDSLNRITQVTTQGLSPQGTVSVSYDYDSNSNRTKLTYPDSSYITYAYDQLNRLTAIKDQAGANITSYTYDALSRRTQQDLANNIQTTYEYDDINRLTKLKGLSPTGTFPEFSYTYDNVGNRKTMTAQGLSPQGTDPETHTYTYDNIYQLKSVDYPAGVTFSDTTFSYDSVGNHISTLNGGTTNYTSNSLNQYSKVGSTDYAYDANGSLTSDGTFTYVYDYENRLISASKTGLTATYTYDAFGRRIKKGLSPQGTVPDTVYVYDGDQIIAEYDAAGTLIKKFIYGAGIDELVKGLSPQGTVPEWYYHYDGLGSVTNLTDSSSATVESYSYDAFGKPNTTSSIGNTRFFTGREYDSETGLYYYRARYYSPGLGRFLQRDPVGYVAGINLYNYVGNNPINAVDPSGLVTVIVHGIGHHEPGYSGELGNYLRANGEIVVEYYWSGDLLALGEQSEVSSNLAGTLGTARRLADARGENLNIISHSQGTRIAFGAVRQSHVKIDNLVTLGSPYASQYPRPGNIRRWVNIWSQLDPISYPSAFTRGYDIRIDTSHTDYWNESEVNPQLLKILDKLLFNKQSTKKK